VDLIHHHLEGGGASYETSLMLCRAAITSDTGDKENQKALMVTGVSLLCSRAKSRSSRNDMQGGALILSLAHTARRRGLGI